MDEFHLFGRFGPSQKFTKVGRNLFLLLDAVSLRLLKFTFSEKSWLNMMLWNKLAEVSLFYRNDC